MVDDSFAETGFRREYDQQGSTGPYLDQQWTPLYTSLSQHKPLKVSYSSYLEDMGSGAPECSASRAMIWPAGVTDYSGPCDLSLADCWSALVHGGGDKTSS